MELKTKADFWSKENRNATMNFVRLENLDLRESCHCSCNSNARRSTAHARRHLDQRTRNEEPFEAAHGTSRQIEFKVHHVRELIERAFEPLRSQYLDRLKVLSLERNYFGGEDEQRALKELHQSFFP